MCVLEARALKAASMQAQDGNNMVSQKKSSLYAYSYSQHHQIGTDFAVVFLFNNLFSILQQSAVNKSIISYLCYFIMSLSSTFVRQSSLKIPLILALHQLAKYTVDRKKTWQYIWHYNSGKTRSIFIIFALV